MGDNSSYNQGAINIYQEAMPGYNIVPVYNNNWSIGWENTDALHCRTRGVMDFNMLFVDHRDVYHGEQEWQAEYPVVSKFIAYSGEPLKTDSLLVYYSINGGEYQVTHMTATGEPDEYVGYITGYEGGSEIDYYVFGADESGHRYTQPVFAELDPHHFTVGTHNPSGELVITPSILWFDQLAETQTFDIINETTNDVIINSIESDNSFLVISPSVFPETIPSGSSMRVSVDFLVPPTKDYNESIINISTSIGDRTVIAMINSNLEDWGLWIPGAPSVELTVNQPQAECYVVNGNYGSQTPIVITDVYEPTSVANSDMQYLEIDYPELPYTLEVGESFVFNVRVKPNTGRGYVQTAVVVVSDQNSVVFDVVIDEELLSVDEISVGTKLYPNPTTGNFTVEGANVAKVEVYNLVGQKVYAEQGKTVTIDAGHWNKGIYLVSITDNNGAVETKKLVVK